ncbi:MAG: signal recognition particle-docking protein FtsY [Candidatus Aenigmarchaeota archaeon]|nr:signal recognition particle-docking protein FtsY [Candidatus Aenigmarchaeota archaeon]
MFSLLKKKLSEVAKKLTGKAKEKEVKKKEVKKAERVKREKEKTVKKKPKLIEKIVRKVTVKKLDENDVLPILQDLELSLVEADVAFETAEKIKKNLVNELVGKEIRRGKEKEVVLNAIKKTLLKILDVPSIDLVKMVRGKKKQGKPFVILFLGYNGSGKTTSMAKLVHFLKKKGFSCVFAAADTFRAASIEQLEEHARKLGIKVIKHRYGADPAAVVFDAIKHAEANRIDVVLADTAGRTHANRNLMDELKKIVRVNKPDLKVLVIDSLTGNDAVEQAKMFDEAVGVDAVMFTKVDVNEKGGAILSVTHTIKKPILFLGTGQGYEDLEIFEKEKFVKDLIS